MWSEPFNELEADAMERLAFLTEEIGETLQAIGKIERHGYESVNPLLPPTEQDTNRSTLEHELGHVLAAIELLVRTRDLDQEAIHQSRRDKLESVQQWMHYDHAEVIDDAQ